MTYLDRLADMTPSADDDVLRLFRSPANRGTAAAQFEHAVAAIVAQAIEEDRAERARAGERWTCSTCHGTGGVVVGAGVTAARVPCPQCGAAGFVVVGKAGGTPTGGEQAAAAAAAEELPRPDASTSPCPKCGGQTDPPPSWASRLLAALSAELADDAVIREVARAWARKMSMGDIPAIARALDELHGVDGRIKGRETATQERESC